MLRNHSPRSIGNSLGLALALWVIAVVPAAGASPVLHARDAAHREVSTVYYPDDICGPRAGWTTFVVTFHLSYVERPDGTWSFNYLETGTYHTDFDDPTIPSYDGQFTGPQHGTITPGGVETYNGEWHDFPGSITIHEHVVFVQVGDEVKIDRDDLRVEGCP